MTTETTTAAERSATTQVYRASIKATPEAIWKAITEPEWIARYGYPATTELELRVGGAYRVLPGPEMKQAGAPKVIVDGEVLELDPHRKLVQTWRARFSPQSEAEGFTKLTYEIEPGPEGVCRLTVIHELDGAPIAAAQVSGQIPGAGGGWSFVLSDLKALLETGSRM